MTNQHGDEMRRSDLSLLASKGSYLAGSNSETELRELLRVLGKLFGVQGICAYFLDTRSGLFEVTEHLGDLNPISPELRVTDDSLLSSSDTEREQKVAKAYATHAPSRAVAAEDPEGSILIIPVVRVSSVVAIVEFLLPAGKWLAEKTMGELISALQPIAWIHSARSIENYFRCVKTPLDFKLPREEFLDQLGELILAATGTQRAALREEVSGQLDCVGFWPANGLTDLRSVSFPTNQYEPFLRALNGETVFERDLRRPGLESLANVEALKDIRSFVVTPVFVGAETFGVLSVAMTYPYSVPNLMMLATEAMANGIGVSLVNYRAHHGTLSLERLGEVSMLMTAVELAQAARHEALDRIDGAIGSLGGVRDSLVKQTKSSQTVLDSIGNVEKYLFEASVAIEKIKVATRPPAFEKQEMVGLESVWNEVTYQLQGRLKQLDIAPRVSGARGVKIPIYRDWFRQAILHLLLNSMDAFEGKSRGTNPPPRRGREITLSVDPVDSKSGTLTFRYSDNAGGINPAALQGPSQFDDVPLEQRIFARNVTSKGGGSGWGMFLIRRILDLHHGSVDLTRYRGGVTFRFTMPLVLQEDPPDD